MSERGDSDEKVAEDRAADPEAVAWRGIELCREGNWEDGLYWLGLAAQAEPGKDSLPSQFYAYLGYGVARYQGQKQQGLRLCRHAVEAEFYQTENFYFLARTCLLMHDRRAAVEAIEKGLLVDARDAELLALKQQLGNRRRPVLSFLPRGHAFNRILGRLRHRLLKEKKVTPGTARAEEEPAPRRGSGKRRR